jgi:hypothetical protein
MFQRWLLFCVFVCVSSYGAASDRRTLEGIVKDPEGAVVQDVRVLIICWGADNLHRSIITEDKHVQTDSNGKYSFELPLGSCDVFFSHSLFAPVTKSMHIKGGEKTALKTQLKSRPGLKLIE